MFSMYFLLNCLLGFQTLYQLSWQGVQVKWLSVNVTMFHFPFEQNSIYTFYIFTVYLCS